MLLEIDAGTINAITSCCFGFSGDGGPAIDALVGQPWDVASDGSHSLFIADTNNNRIRKIDAKTGIISTIAGSGPTNPQEGYGQGTTCGDGGPTIDACINTPYGIAIAPDGTMYIGENHERVRKVDPKGTITTFFTGSGNRLRLNSVGNLFMTPYRIEPNGHAFQFAGTAPGGNLGDGGPAAQANFATGSQDSGIAIDAEGNLFFSDGANRRIRAIRFGALIAEPGSTVSAISGTPQSATVGAAFSIPLEITLRSPAGTPENGIRVNFNSPTSGPSCLLSNGSTNYSVLTDINGQASVTCTANSQIGSYSVIATPLALGQAASFALSNTVNTSATISSSQNPSRAGTPVTLTAGISQIQVAGAPPDGMAVNFYDGATLLGSAPLASGKATFATTFSSTGVHSISAVYAGDLIHLSSSSSILSQVVTSAASASSTTALTANGVTGTVPIYFGVASGQQGATFVVTVSGSSYGDSVVLLDGASELGPVLALTSGKASYSTQLSVGQHNMQAVYIGNASVAGSSSPIVIVNRSPRPKPR